MDLENNNLTIKNPLLIRISLIEAKSTKELKTSILTKNKLIQKNMKTTLIIKGGIYFNGDVILKAHYSGYFFMVDCTEYKTKKQIKSEYSKEIAKEFLNGYYITNDGIKYYECEFSPYYTENLDLLNDVSDLEFTYDQNEF